MAGCSLYPSSSSHIASRPYGHKIGTQSLSGKDWNIKFKKHLKMHQITLFQDKKSKNFLERGTAPPQTPPPVRRGTPPPHILPLSHTPHLSATTAPRCSRIRRSLLGAFGVSWLKDDIVFQTFIRPCFLSSSMFSGLG